MIFALTGGTGFIGRALVRCLLGAGDEVRLLTRTSPAPGVYPAAVTTCIADLTRPEDARALLALLEGADVVVHGAGQVRDKATMRALHVEGTRRLVAAARGKVRRWVQLSSAGAYGPRAEGIVDEQTAPAPSGEYEVTKAEADRLVLDAAAHGAFEAVVLRPTIVFGPSMPNQSLYQLIALLDRGWFGFIGRPGAMANYVFVDDVADALRLCATSPRASGIYNLSDDRTLEVFVATLAEALARPSPARRLPEVPLRAAARLLQRLPGFPLSESRIDALTRRTAYPSARIRQELGFEFRVGVEEGLRRLVADWRTR